MLPRPPRGRARPRSGFMFLFCACPGGFVRIVRFWRFSRKSPKWLKGLRFNHLAEVGRWTESPLSANTFLLYFLSTRFLATARPKYVYTFRTASGCADQPVAEIVPNSQPLNSLKNKRLHLQASSVRHKVVRRSRGTCTQRVRPSPVALRPMAGIHIRRKRARAGVRAALPWAQQPVPPVPVFPVAKINEAGGEARSRPGLLRIGFQLYTVCVQ
jgi:hypothetical protein